MKNIFSTITIAVIFSSLMVLLPKTALAQGVIALDDQLDEYWVVEKKVAPRYPSRALRNGISGCVAVGYIIEADGTTADQKVLAFSPLNLFNKSAIKAAKKFKYQPSQQNPDKIPVLTVNVFTYEILESRQRKSKKQKKLGGVCSTAAKKVLEPHMGKTDAG